MSTKSKEFSNWFKNYVNRGIIEALKIQLLIHKGLFTYKTSEKRGWQTPPPPFIGKSQKSAEPPPPLISKSQKSSNPLPPLINKSQILPKKNLWLFTIKGSSLRPNKNEDQLLNVKIQNQKHFWNLDAKKDLQNQPLHIFTSCIGHIKLA